MNSGESFSSSRRHFMAACAAPLMAVRTPIGMAPSAPTTIDWQGAVDAYLERNLELASSVLSLDGDVLTDQIVRRFNAWSGAVLDVRSEERRLTVRRLQGAAAFALELPQPLTASGRSGSARLLERVAETALRILETVERHRSAPPADRQGRSPDEIRRSLAIFRGRWNVAYLQMLVNDRRMSEAHAVAQRIVLPQGDRALPEAHYLRGVLQETAIRIADPKALSAEDLLPQSRVQWINARLSDAATRYRRALEASPPHREARLRLGRVELERGRHARALDVLQPLRGDAGVPWIAGLATLFAGAAHMALGSLDDAARAFTDAAQVPDTSQSARVALMRLALRRGAPQDAADATRAFAVSRAQDPEDRPDAWLVYISGRRPDDEAVLGPMRDAMLP